MRFLNKSLRILLLTDALVLVSGAMIIPYYAVFVGHIGGDILDAGIAASMFAIAAGCSALVAGKLTDKIKQKKFVVGGGYLVMALGFLSYAFIGSVWELLIVQVVIGLAQATYTPAYDALYTDHIGDRRFTSSRWGIWESLNYFSIAIGAVLGSLVIQLAGFKALFLVMATLCTVSGIYLVVLPRRRL